MKPTALRRRARAEGVAEHVIEDAEDNNDDPKGAIIELIAAAQKKTDYEPFAELRAELLHLKPTSLRRRARADGVAEEEIEAAEDDDDDPRAAMIELILAAQTVPQEVMTSQDTPTDDGRLVALVEELSKLKPSALRKRAQADGVSVDALEEAEDSDNPKSAVIKLLLGVQPPDQNTTKTAAEASLRQELSALKIAALHKRARAVGIDQDQLDDVLDTDSPKDALISLLISALGVADTGSAKAALRQELDGLKMAALTKRARANGIAQDVLDDLLDVDSPRYALISLVVDTELQSGTDMFEVESNLRQELEGLKMAALMRRARTGGIDQDELDKVQDAESPKNALISLLVDVELYVADAAPPSIVVPAPTPSPEPVLEPASAPSPVRKATATMAPNTRSHFGVAKQPQQSSSRTRAPRLMFSNGMHAMLSYQWDHQDLVTKTRKKLQAHVIQCWMDIDGGMGADIFESMAQGVQGAAVVICFMSRKYQSSDNCKLELKFARQTGVPICPVKMEQEWNASDWLGIITAGSLWTPLYSDTVDFEQNIASLVQQIKCVAGVAEAAMVEGSGDEFSVGEMREELERLRMDGAQKLSRNAIQIDGKAVLPAVIPEVPEGGLIVSDAMHKLVDTVCSLTSKRRCGFFGMGGIGKTTTSAWLCRQDAVRSHFETICWVAL
eukprot:COSAG05_NODE_1770_length_4114_cov_1.871113_2_plen_673_part_00